CMPRSDVAQRLPRAWPNRRDEHAGNAGRCGARQYRVAVGVERGNVEVAMRVDHGQRRRGAVSISAVAVKLVRRWSHWWRTSETVLARWLRAAHSALLGEMPILAA